MTNSVDPDQTFVGSGSTLFASILKLVRNVRQTTSADVIFQMHFFLGALRVNSKHVWCACILSSAFN